MVLRVFQIQVESWQLEFEIHLRAAEFEEKQEGLAEQQMVDHGMEARLERLEGLVD